MGKIALIEYTVPIKGLSIGKHNYSFSVDSAFFKDFGESPISEASLELEAELIKEAALIKVTCDITGTVVVECDRCLEDLTLPVKTTAGLIVKFVRTEEEEERGDDFGPSGSRPGFEAVFLRLCLPESSAPESSSERRLQRADD